MAAVELGVRLTYRDLVQAFALEGLTLEVEEYGFSTDGGPKDCTITARGSEDALQQLFNILRGKVEVIGPDAETVWWGCLWSVVIHDNKLNYGFSLDGLANKINIIYLQQTVNQQYSGAGTQAETGFGSDTLSIAEYGTFEKRLRSGNMSSSAALSERTKELTNRADPLFVLDTGGMGGELTATIECRGWIETLDVRLYENSSGNAAGFEDNSVITSEVDQFLGRAHPTKTTVKWTATTSMYDSSATMAISASAPFNHIWVSGTASNNKMWTVSSVPQPGACHILAAPPNVITEAAGASALVHFVGTEIYQTFGLATNNPFYAAALDLRLKRSGCPVGDVTIGLYADSSGCPGALMDTATITGSDVGTYMAWRTGVFASACLIAFGSTYGIKLSRSASEALDCFVAGVDAAVSYSRGSLKLWAGATYGWQSKLNNADLIFKLSGIVETTQQVVSVLGSVGEFVTGAVIDSNSGLKTLPYQDGSLTARQVIKNLLKSGSSNSKRLLMEVTENRQLRVYEEPDVTDVRGYMLDNEATLQPRAEGLELPKYKCPYGFWAEVKPLVHAPVPTRYAFVDEVRYNVRDDDLQVVRVRNRTSPFAVTSLEQ